MKVFASCLLFLFTLLANAETKTVVGEGDSFTCYKREESLKLAHSAADSDGRDACNALGADWRYSRREFAGYEQCRQCGSSKEYICYVTKATYQCTNIAKEKAEKLKNQQEQNKSVVMDNANQYVNKQNELLKNQKAPKDLTSKTSDNGKAEKARIAKKDKDLGKQNEVDSDDPFAELDKPNAKQISKQDKLDDAFASLDTTSQYQSSEGVAGDIDQSFEEIELHKLRKEMIASRIIVERENNKRDSVKACKQIMQSVDACFNNVSCKRPENEPTENTCKNIPYQPCQALNFYLTRSPRPGDPCYIQSSRECRAIRAEREAEERIEKQACKIKIAEWQSSYGGLLEQCREKKKNETAFVACQKDYKKQCNPNGFDDEASCVESRIASVPPPTEKEVRAILQKEWNAKSVSEKKKLTGNPTRVLRMNFLE